MCLNTTTRLGFPVDRAHGGSRERTAEIDPSKTDGRDPSVHDRATGDGDDDVSGDVISGDGSGGASSSANDGATTRTEGTRTDGEGADEDGGDLATTMATFPSDDDDWSDGGTRLKRRRRRRREGKGREDLGKHFPSFDFTGEGKERPDLEGDGGGSALGFRAAAAGASEGARAAAADWADLGRGEREREGFGPKAKRDF
uniref:Uncharacterized protein n=1 Tax=Oryza sativa subsp. japonica TaxID=39947 RepID=Q6K6N2_ORYSJ|nr:hypothetical protein [Oryza sativa Japonica Group]